MLQAGSAWTVKILLLNPLKFKLLFLKPEIFLNPPFEKIHFGNDVAQIFLLLRFQVGKQEHRFHRRRTLQLVAVLLPEIHKTLPVMLLILQANAATFLFKAPPAFIL